MAPITVPLVLSRSGPLWWFGETGSSRRGLRRKWPVSAV